MPALLHKRARGKQAVAQVGFGDRAKTDDRPASNDRPPFRLGDVRRMDKTPVGPDLGPIVEPFDRARSAPCDACLDLGHLFGDVDMNRRALRHSGDRCQFVGGRGAQAVRRHADQSVVQPRDRIAGTVEKRLKARDVVNEATLSMGRRPAAKTRMGVKDGK